MNKRIWDYCFGCNNPFEKAIIDSLFPTYVERVQTEIELRQIRYFLAIAEERSFTRAAKRCHVALSSLSRQIGAMEISLGSQLFERLPREIRLTQAGRIFEKQANEALEHSRRAVSLVRSLNREKDHKLRIGLSTLCNLPSTKALVETAQRASGQIAVECITGYTPELIVALHRGSLDLVLVDLPLKSRGIGLYPISSEPLITVLPKSHPLAQRPMVRLFELKKEQIAMVSRHVDPGSVSIETMLVKTGVGTSSLVPVGSLIELLDQIPAHRSVGLMRSSAGRIKHDEVLYKPLSDSVQLETAIAWRAENKGPQMMSFRDAMIAFAQRSVDPQPT